MDTLAFLQRVLPSEGFYVTTVINGPEPHQRKQALFSSVDELAQVCVQLDQQGNNTYFAVASFKERRKKGNRKQDNVLKLRSVPLDLDVGEDKPFKTQRDAVKALNEFLIKTDLPRPMILSSGRGVHAYWVFDRDLVPEEWQPIANAVKTAALAHQFEIDAGITGDSARVMRPVGTHNPKNGKIVKMLLDAPAYAVDTFRSALASLGVHAVAPSAPKTTLLDNLAVKHEFPPASPSVISTKCQQIEWAVANQEQVQEPMWYAMIGVAAFCIEPEETAKAWSSQHSKYDEGLTLRKLEQWKRSATGPSTCAKIEQARPGGCKGCKFKGNVTTPCRLGVTYAEVPPPPEAANETANLIKLPRPFKRTTDGIKVTIDDTDVDVCPFDIIPQGYGRDEGLGYETVRYLWNRPHKGWVPLVLRQAYLTDGHREFPTVIADQGIVLYNKRQTEYFQLMIRSYMDQLRKLRGMSNLYATMGWKENFSQFVIGDSVIKRDPDGAVIEDTLPLAAGATRLGSELYGKAGDRDAWVRMTGILEQAGMPWHMFALSVGLSAPLYAFTGLKGLTVSLYGPTGGGKTLIQYWIQSLWGHPEKLHFAAKFTQNTLFSRLGLYCHMPMTIDEATMMQDDEVGDFCYWVSQGRDKARLNRNADERDAKTWATPVIVSTNKSMASKLIASGLETDAQMARLLEVDVPAHRLFTKNTDAGRKIYQFLMENYGHIGYEFARKLVELGAPAVQALIKEATETFTMRYGAEFAGEERYWEQAVILQDLAARLAKEWGLIDFDPRKSTEWVLDRLGTARKVVADNKLDAFDVLSAFINDNADVAVTVMHNGTATPMVDYTRMPRGEIRARFDFYRPNANVRFDTGTLMMDRGFFRRWLSKTGYDYRTIVSELTKEGIICTPKSEKFYLGKDTPTKLGQAYVVGVNLNHPRLQGMMNDADAAAANPTLGQPLRLVAGD